MSKPLSREFRIYLAIWRKAYRERNDPSLPPVVVHASTFSTALAMRQGLYRAIRPYRDGTAIDEELRQAAECFVVSVIRKDDLSSVHTLELKPRITLSELEAELLNLGLDAEDLMTEEEKRIRDDYDNFAGNAAPTRSNPFYTRED